MKRWPLVLITVIWLGLGVMISWVYGLSAHTNTHTPATEAHAAEAAPGH